MSQKKLPSKLSAEELMKALETNEVSEVDTLGSSEGNVVQFLQEYKITSGEYKVSTRLLFKLYQRWTVNKLSQPAFNRAVSMYIQREFHYYLLDKNTFEITEEINRIPQGTNAFKTDPAVSAFIAFKKAFKVEAGKYYIQPAVLYYLYDNWAYETNSKYIPFNTFLKVCKFHFDLKTSADSSTWFCISDSIKEFLTEEKLEKALDWAEKYYGKDAKKKQQKKIEEVPSSREKGKS